METQLVFKPQNGWGALGFYEYLLVANPDASVNEKVLTEKQNFFDKYNQRISIKTKPHITVANFLAREGMEETLSRYIQRICNQHQSFEVALNNFSGFPPHTIYLRVQNQQPFKHLAKELGIVGNYISSCSCPPATFISNPYLTIARRLPETVYSKAMMDYSQKTFHEKFDVKELLLLRRSSQYEPCKMVHVFPLQPPAKTLFN